MNNTEAKSWSVTLKTGPSTWSTVEVDAANHLGAVAEARRLLGAYPVSKVI